MNELEISYLPKARGILPPPLHHHPLIYVLLPKVEHGKGRMSQFRQKAVTCTSLFPPVMELYSSRNTITMNTVEMCL